MSDSSKSKGTPLILALLLAKCKMAFLGLFRLYSLAYSLLFSLSL